MSLWIGSSWHIRPSIPFKKESPITVALLFFLTMEVMMLEVHCPALGDLSKLDGPSSTSSFPWSSSSRASYLLCKGTQGSEVG